MQRKHKDQKQLDWNCFDVAIDISRENLVTYALDHGHDPEFRAMLALEIRHAAAITVTYMNIEKAGTYTEIEKALSIAELMQIKNELNPVVSESKENVIFPRGSLPKSMRTPELQELVDQYQQAHEQMRAAVSTCNDALGHPEGKRLPLEKLDAFFENAENRAAHSKAYEAFKTERNAIFTLKEQNFYNFCALETTYRKYITDYYGQHEWVAFQRSFDGEHNKSMVDIAARMTSSCIIIYQREKNRVYKEIYRTDNYGATIKHVEFMENCHFVEVDPNEPDVDPAEIAKELKEEAAGVKVAPALSYPLGKDALLPGGFAGSIYQVKILMLLAFTAFCKKQRFHLYTEAKGVGKFDDGVLFLEEGMQVMQAKHCFTPGGYYLIKHLTGEGEEKKAALSKYFNSWLMIQTLRRKDPSRYRGVVEYLFFTNHMLNVEEGLSELYNETTGRFSTNLLGRALAAGTKPEEARQAIMRSIYENIREIQKKVTNACNEVITLFEAFPKVNGKAKDAVTIEAKNCSSEVKILFALLLQYECIVIIQDEKKKFRDGCFYKFTAKFLPDVEAEKLPPVLRQLRKLLFSKEKFKTELQRENFLFTTINSNFANLEKTSISSAVNTILLAVNAALSTGYFGLSEDDFLAYDLSNMDEFLSLPAPQCVREFFQQFQFKVKQPNEAEMTKVLGERIGEHFDITDSCFYHYFYERMLNFLLTASDVPITDADVENLFAEARRVLDRNRLVGHSLRYEYHLSHVHDIKLDVAVTTTFVTDFYASDRNVMVCYGHNDWLVAMTVYSELKKLRKKRKLREDNYGFVDAKYALLDADETVFAVEPFQLLVVDHAELLTEKQLQKLIAQATLAKKKLILLTVNHEKLKQQIRVTTGIEIEDDTFHKISLLSNEVVDRNIAAKIHAAEGVIVGERFVSFEEMSLQPGYREIISDPYALAAMLKQAVPQPVERKPGKQRLFIAPSLTYKNAIYKIEAVLSIKYRIIYFDFANFSSTAQVLILDLAALSDEEKKLSLKKLIQEKKDKNRPPPQALYIQHVAEWNKLSDKLRQDIKAYSKLIFVSEAIPEELGNALKLCHQDLDGEDRYSLVDAAMFEYMPETSEYASVPDILYDGTLVQRTKYPCRRVILSDYGSGKTYLTEELLRDQNSTFAWIVRISAKTLSEEMSKWSLEQLAEYYLGIPPLEEWQMRLLQCDIMYENALWVVDGFDEILAEQREALKELIDRLVSQPYCLVASRPSAAPFIPLQPNQFITLQPFDDGQINAFVDSFFINEEQREVAKRLIISWKKENRLHLLGKPLMCRIACEIIDAGTDAEELCDITLASLFDYFIQVNFRKYQRDHNRMPDSRLNRKRLYHVSHAMVNRLKQVAYAKLFPRHMKDVCILPDDVLDRDLLQLGLITQISVIPATDPAHYLFDHQTQVEYFAALYWVEKLLQVSLAERAEHVKRVWSDELYNVELRVVWQFVAGIVSADQNIFLEGSGNDAFDIFCSFLLDYAEDLVGKVHQELLYSCYHNMQRFRLEGSEYKSRFEACGSATVAEMRISDDNGKQIQEFRVVGKKSQSSRQIIADYAYQKLYDIPDYQIALTRDVQKVIREFLEKTNLEILTKLPLLKKYLQRDEVDEEIVAKIRDKMLEIYLIYKDNDREYFQAYALLAFMLDKRLIELKDCVETFTQDFDQKNCVLDVVRRLSEASLLTSRHLEILFKIGRARFWDYDVGLPAILLLRNLFDQSMVAMLKANIIGRNSGDWEISRAIQVLIEISQESYEFSQLSSLLSLIIEIYTADKKHINAQQMRDLEHNLFTSQNVKLMLDFFSGYFATVQVYNIKYFHAVLQLLNHFCRHYDLAVVMENSSLRIMGRICGTVDLPKIAVIQEFTCEMLRAFRDEKDGGAEKDKSEAFRHLHKQFEVGGIYCKFLIDRNSLVCGVNDEKDLEILKTLAAFLPPPTPIKQGLEKDFCQLEMKRLPNKDSFNIQVAVLRAFGKCLGFVDTYLCQYAIFYAKKKERADFWDCDAGIAATAWLGNNFGKGAYMYLKYCYTSWDYCKSYVHNVLVKVTIDTLSDSTAILSVLKTILVVEITKGGSLNELGKTLVKNLESIDRTRLVQEFIRLRQSKELNDTECKKLQLLSVNWQADIRMCLEEKIGSMKVTGNPASMFYRTQKNRTDDYITTEHGRKRSNSF